jgi:hypothetical protein
VIDPVEVEARRLAKLDSPRRVAWLRQRVRPYVIDLAARAYFRLPTWCAGQEIPDPKEEALAACTGTAASHGLTGDETSTAFRAEWDAAMKTAVQAGEKLKIAALSHLKLTRDTAGIPTALRTTAARFPENWPYLAPHDLEAIAAGFQRDTPRRRSAA